MARNINIDLIKTVALIMVIVIHVSSIYFSLGPTWIAANFYDSLSRGAVPLFFMCSGALLLGKIEPLGIFFKKRVIRIIPAILAWSLIYYAFNDRPFTADSLLNILYGPTEVHLWYLYAAAGISLFIPLFRRCVQSITAKESALFIALWFLSSSVAPLLMQLTGVSLATNYHLYAFSGYAGCLFLGYFMLQTKSNLLAKSLCYVAFMASIYLIFRITAWSSAMKGWADLSFYDTLTPMSVVSFCALFYILLHTKMNSGVEFIVKHISRLSLGIYCSHMIFLAYIEPHFNNVNPWISIPLISLIVMIPAITTSIIFSRIPYLKSIV